MIIVGVCEALKISLDEYWNLPNWYIDLRLGKLSADISHQKKVSKK